MSNYRIVAATLCALFPFACSSGSSSTSSSTTSATTTGSSSESGTSTTESNTGTTSETETDTEASTTDVVCLDPTKEICDGRCVDLSSNPNHCNGCGQACSFGTQCVNGTCSFSCDELTQCTVDGSDVCVDLLQNPNHCGDCNQACDQEGKAGCAEGQCFCFAATETLCGNTCANTDVHTEHCGDCFNACPPPPANGQGACDGAGSCTFACAAYYTLDSVLQPSECVSCNEDEVMMDGPIHYWRLSENMGIMAADAIGGAHGEYVGGPILGVEGALSPSDRAIAFQKDEVPETSPRVRIPDFNMPANEFTLEVVVKITGSNTTHPIISLASGPGNDANQLLLYHDNPNPNVGRLIYKFAANGFSKFAPRFDDGNWHLITITWKNGDDANLGIYIDQQQAVDLPGFAAEASLPQNATLVFGQDQDDIDAGYKDNEQLVGAIDSVIIYDKVLPKERVFAHYNTIQCKKGLP